MKLEKDVGRMLQREVKFIINCLFMLKCILTLNIAAVDGRTPRALVDFDSEEENEKLADRPKKKKRKTINSKSLLLLN